MTKTVMKKQPKKTRKLSQAEVAKIALIPEDGLVTPLQLEFAINVPRRTLSLWQRQGWLPFVKYGAARNGPVRFNIKKVRKAIDEKFERNATKSR
jgi:hypothetical protein